MQKLVWSTTDSAANWAGSPWSDIVASDMFQ